MHENQNQPATELVRLSAVLAEKANFRNTKDTKSFDIDKSFRAPICEVAERWGNIVSKRSTFVARSFPELFFLLVCLKNPFRMARSLASALLHPQCRLRICGSHERILAGVAAAWLLQAQMLALSVVTSAA